MPKILAHVIPECFMPVNLEKISAIASKFQQDKQHFFSIQDAVAFLEKKKNKQKKPPKELFYYGLCVLASPTCWGMVRL